MFHEHQLQLRPGYDGPLKDWPIERIRATFQELLRCCETVNQEDMPLPPAGLPGHLHRHYDRWAPAGDLLAIGLGYLSAIVFNERRSMHNRWAEASQFINRVRSDARDDLFEEIAARERADAEATFAEQAARQDRPQLVYFIATEGGPIKIGIAAHPAQRCRDLQTSHHEKLLVLATCDGGQPLEREYHKRFAAHRLHGEWFERHPDILAEIDRLTPSPPPSLAFDLAAGRGFGKLGRFA